MIGLLFRAATGFALAFTALHPGAITAGIGPARLAALKSDIASQQPGVHLQAALDDLLMQPSKNTSARTGTEGVP
jgi:hypothetical protein